MHAASDNTRGELSKDHAEHRRERPDKCMCIFGFAEQANCVDLYTCSLYTFLVGTNRSSFFLIDTLPISEELSGNGNGILVATSDTSERSCNLD